MSRLLFILVISLSLITNWPCYSQHKDTITEETEHDSSQSSNQQLNRITRQLQQHQAALNESVGYPSVKQIQKDLVGHSLAEGVENGYRPADWRWKIEEGQISKFRITQVLKKSKSQYVLMAQMCLSNGHYAYDTKVKTKYVYTTKDRWRMDYVISEGMNIVVTHEYDKFIRSEIVDDGWGGTYCVLFTNISELSLCVGGDILTNNDWQRFSKVVPAGENATVGGVFGGGSVEDYRINFVVRVN